MRLFWKWFTESCGTKLYRNIEISLCAVLQPYKYNKHQVVTYIFSGFHQSESEVLFVPKYWVLRILLRLCPNLHGSLSPLLEESFSTNLQFFSWSISSLFAKILLCFGLVCSKRGWHLLPLLRRKYRLSRGRCLYIAGQNSFEQVRGQFCFEL